MFTRPSGNSQKLSVPSRGCTGYSTAPTSSLWPRISFQFFSFLLRHWRWFGNLLPKQMSSWEMWSLHFAGNSNFYKWFFWSSLSIPQVEKKEPTDHEQMLKSSSMASHPQEISPVFPTLYFNKFERWWMMAAGQLLRLVCEPRRRLKGRDVHLQM